MSETRQWRSLRRNNDIITADMNGEVVMMDAQRGMYYNLGSTGSRIWELIAQPMTLDALVEKLMDIYEVERAQCLKDILPFIDKMIERQLIIVE